MPRILTISSLVLGIVVGTVLLHSPALGEERIEDQLIEFEIKDQFDNEHTKEEFEGHVLVVIGSDKGGSDYNGIWGTALADSLVALDISEYIMRMGVADVRGVPFFIKGMVKGKFPKEPSKWTLTDWQGKFAEAYDWQKGHANIDVFDHEGQLVYHTAETDLDGGRFDALVDAVVAALEKKNSESTSRSEH